jgi:hypothetical protein
MNLIGRDGQTDRRTDNPGSTRSHRQVQDVSRQVEEGAEVDFA